MENFSVCLFITVGQLAMLNYFVDICPCSSLYWLIQNFYGKAVGRITVDQGYAEMFSSERLHPLPFTVYGEIISVDTSKIRT